MMSGKGMDGMAGILAVAAMAKERQHAGCYVRLTRAGVLDWSA